MTSVEAYRRYLETLTPESLAQLDAFVAPDVRFADPFNDVTGAGAMRQVFEEMFASVQDIAFKVDDLAVSGPTALLSWRFDGTLCGRPFTLEGMSRIRFDADGRVREHVDHWDSATQFYMHLPIIGWLLKYVRGRMATR